MRVDCHDFLLLYDKDGQSMNVLKQYLLSITAAALLFSFSSELLTSGKWKKISGLLGSIILILAIVSPIFSLDTDDLTRSISKFLLETEMEQTGIEINSRELQSILIKENIQTYIQDRAMAMGIKLQVDVRMRDDGQFPIPDFVALHGAISTDEKEKMIRFISGDLGIPEDKQEWIAE